MAATMGHTTVDSMAVSTAVQRVEQMVEKMADN
jgi:hypothetical protein